MSNNDYLTYQWYRRVGEDSLPYLLRYLQESLRILRCCLGFNGGREMAQAVVLKAADGRSVSHRLSCDPPDIGDVGASNPPVPCRSRNIIPKSRSAAVVRSYNWTSY